MQKPKIVCLCGSTRFSYTFREAKLRETLAENIVLTVGCDTKSDTDLFGGKSPEEQLEIKARLDALHLRKVEMADEILILNVGGYIGESTRRELNHALDLNKWVRYWATENPGWIEPQQQESSEITVNLRDYFAAAAMQSIFTDPGAHIVAARDERYDETNWDFIVASNAYDMADAMIKERTIRSERGQQ